MSFEHNANVGTQRFIEDTIVVDGFGPGHMALSLPVKPNTGQWQPGQILAKDTDGNYLPCTETGNPVAVNKHLVDTSRDGLAVVIVFGPVRRGGLKVSGADEVPDSFITQLNAKFIWPI